MLDSFVVLAIILMDFGGLVFSFFSNIPVLFEHHSPINGDNEFGNAIASTFETQ